MSGSSVIGQTARRIMEQTLSLRSATCLHDAFPRLLGVAELSWSPKGQDWEDYRQRLAAHGPRMEAMGINFFKSPDVDWE